MSAQPEKGDAPDKDKRRQILNGAREVFLAKGYEGASMDAIAKASGVSKGTLYVYFDNKDELFVALTAEEKRAISEAICTLEPHGGSFRENLETFAVNFCELLTAAGHISSLRMVIGAVEKFPGVGEVYFRNGAERGATRLTEVFEQAIADGRMRPCDPKVAAQHFVALCTSEVLKRALFAADANPAHEAVVKTVRDGLDVFWTYYGL